jgi:hypothetical protein
MRLKNVWINLLRSTKCLRGVWLGDVVDFFCCFLWPANFDLVTGFLDRRMAIGNTTKSW